MTTTAPGRPRATCSTAAASAARCRSSTWPGRCPRSRSEQCCACWPTIRRPRPTSRPGAGCVDRTTSDRRRRTPTTSGGSADRRDEEATDLVGGLVAIRHREPLAELVLAHHVLLGADRLQHQGGEHRADLGRTLEAEAPRQGREEPGPEAV